MEDYNKTIYSEIKTAGKIKYVSNTSCRFYSLCVHIISKLLIFIFYLYIINPSNIYIKKIIIKYLITCKFYYHVKYFCNFKMANSGIHYMFFNETFILYLSSKECLFSSVTVLYPLSFAFL